MCYKYILFKLKNVYLFTHIITKKNTQFFTNYTFVHLKRRQVLYSPIYIKIIKHFIISHVYEMLNYNKIII